MIFPRTLALEASASIEESLPQEAAKLFASAG